MKKMTHLGRTTQSSVSRTTGLFVALGCLLTVGASEAPPLRTNVHLKNYCGPSCLTVFLEMNGIRASVEEVAVLAQTGPKGSSLLGLKRAAEAKGLQAVGAQVSSWRDLKQLGVPCIAFVRTDPDRQPDHFILVTGFDRDSARVVEPPHKPYLIPAARLDEMLEGRVLLLSRGPITPPSSSPMVWSAGIGFGCVLVAGFAVSRVRRNMGPRSADASYEGAPVSS